MPEAKRRPGRPPSPKPPKRDHPGQPAHQPSEQSRNMVAVMVAGGIAQSDIARSLRLSIPTLVKHYRNEIDTGTTQINTIVLVEHMKLIRAGDFHAIKWWQQSRMGYRETIAVDDGKPADTPMRVVVEFVGEAAPVIEHEPLRSSTQRLSNDIRKHVQLVG